MRPPTPPQLRQVVVRLHELGHSYSEIAEVTGLGYATVNRVLRLFRETNGLAPRAPGGGNYSPIRGRVEQALRELVAMTPDATVAELSVALREQQGVSTSRSAVQRALLRMALSRKKRVS